MYTELAYFNYYYALLGLLGGLTNLITAIMLFGTDYLYKPSANYLNNGIYAYNGILVGLMCGTFVDGLDVSFSENNGYLVFLKLAPCVMVFSYIATSIHIGMTNMYPDFPGMLHAKLII